jgi:molecular chaperone DnaK (HSP70)
MEEHDGKIVVDDIVGRSLGTDVEGGRMHILIEGTAPLGAEEQSTYIPTSVNPEKIPVHVYQGENTEDRSANEKLRDWYVKPPSTDKEQPRITVTFEIDEDSVLHISAEDADTGEELGTMQVDTTGGDINEEDFSTEKAEADD